MSSAIAAETSVPTTSGSASPISRTKKNAIRSRTPSEMLSSPICRTRAGMRDCGDRSKVERPPCGIVPASIRRRSGARDRGAVADQAVDLRLRRALDLIRERGVLQVLGDVLAVAERVVQPRLHELGLVL